MKSIPLDSVQKEFPSHIFSWSDTVVDTETFEPICNLLIDGINSEIRFSLEFLQNLHWKPTAEEEIHTILINSVTAYFNTTGE